jgi:hypothetical protein
MYVPVSKRKKARMLISLFVVAHQNSWYNTVQYIYNNGKTNAHMYTELLHVSANYVAIIRDMKYKGLIY